MNPEDLIAAANNSTVIEPEPEEEDVATEESGVSFDPAQLTAAAENSDQRVLPKDVFDGSEYSRVPSLFSSVAGPLLKRFADANSPSDVKLPTPNLDLNNPVLIELAETEEFKNAGDFEKQDMIRYVLRQSNKQIYDDQPGEETLFGLGPKVQKVITPELEEDTVTVPSPTFTAGDGPIPGLYDVAGAIYRGGAKFADSVLSTFGADEVIPTVPNQSTGGAILDEITSVMTGGLVGAGLVDRLMKVPGMTSAAANSLSKGYAKLKGKKPEEVIEGTSMLVRAAAIELGVIGGATLATPQNSETLVGGDIIESFGFDKDDDRLAAVFVDNAAFSVFLKAGVELGKGIYKGVKKAFPVGSSLPGKGGQRLRDAEAAAEVLRMIDPMAEGMKGVRLARRAQIMGGVMQKNKEFTFSLLGGAKIQGDSTTALLKGAKEYVERAYIYRKALMGADEWEKFVTQHSELVAGKMIALKKTRLNSSVVQQQDANMVGQMQGALTDTAEQLGGVEATNFAAAQLAQDGIERIRLATNNLENADIDVMQATADLTEALRSSEFTVLLREAQGNNSMGAVTDALSLEDGLAAELLDGFLKTQGAYKKAFADLPTVDADITPIVEAIMDASTPLNKIDKATNEGLNNPLFKRIVRVVKRTMDKLGEGMDENALPIEASEIAEVLMSEGVDFKQLFITVRPRLSRAIDQGMANKEDVGTLVALKNSIDALAADTPQYGEALGLYANHRAIFTETEPLREFAKTANSINPALVQASGRPAGENNALVSAAQAIKQSLDPESSAFFDPIITALSVSGDAPVEQVAGAMVGRVMQSLALAVEGGNIDSTAQIVNAFAPYADKLKLADPEKFAVYNNALKDLQALQQGKMTSEKFLARSNNAYSATLAEVKSSAASNFIYDITNNPEVLDNAPAAFTSIFNKFSTNTNVLKRIMAEANTKDPTVVEGIQAHYLTWLAGQLRAARRMGLKASDTGMDAVRDIKPGALDRLIRDPNSPVLKNLSIIFENDPDRAAQAVALLDLQDQILTGRAVRPETFGSTTAYDQQQKKLMDRFTVLMFGVLNPTATVVRNMSEAVTKNGRQAAQEATQAGIDFMVAYPDKFSAAMELVMRNELGGARDILGFALLRDTAGAVSETSPFVARGVFAAEPAGELRSVYDLPEGWSDFLETEGGIGVNDQTRAMLDAEKYSPLQSKQGVPSVLEQLRLKKDSMQELGLQ